MSGPFKLVKSKPNEELIKALEQLLEEAKRGETVGVVAFRFGELTPNVSHIVAGSVLEDRAVFAIERWKFDVIRDTFDK